MKVLNIYKLQNFNYARSMATNWWNYVSQVMDQHEETRQTSAKRVDIDVSNYTRWASGTKPKPEIAVKFARSYGENVLEALVAVELITEREAALTTKDMSKLEMLGLLTDKDLASEILNRVSGDSDSILTRPMGGDVFEEVENNLRHLKAVDSVSEGPRIVDPIAENLAAGGSKKEMDQDTDFD